MPTDTPQPSADLVFIHLSDLHFRTGQAGDRHDPDEMIRNELQLDLRRLRSRLPRFDGLIVSGDIAFSGKPEEFEYGGGWIESIRELLGCNERSVMMIAGNHDVDHAFIPIGGDVHQLHQQIRDSQSLAQYDDRLAQTLRDSDRGRLLLSPLAAFNSYASKYGCGISRESPYWERDFRLSDGTTLRFRGIATILLSSPQDDRGTCRMLYGAAQRTILRKPNVRYVLIGHHPPSWSIEGEEAEQTFSALTFLQVFGHEHQQWLTKIGNSVRLIAGAVQPSRRDAGWQPRYSAFSISVVNETTLVLRIYPRRWSTEEFTFIGDYNLAGNDIREYRVPVEGRQQ
jgi:hypothetical protein